MFLIFNFDANNAPKIIRLFLLSTFEKCFERMKIGNNLGLQLLNRFILVAFMINETCDIICQLFISYFQTGPTKPQTQG